MSLVGLSTVCFIAAPFDHAVDFVLQNGFDHVEIYSDIPHAWPDWMDSGRRADLRRRFDSAGVHLSVHSPAYALNIGSLNPGLRAESVRQITGAIELASDLGAENVVVHGGTAHFLHPQLWEDTKAKSRQAVIRSLEECVSRAEKLGVTVCLENLCLHGAVPGTLAEVADVVRGIGSRSLRIAFDIAHFSIMKEPMESVGDAADLIVHVHISDNDGFEDTHLPMGHGKLEVARFLPFLRTFDGPIVMEIEDVRNPGEMALESREWLGMHLS